MRNVLVAVAALLLMGLSGPARGQGHEKPPQPPPATDLQYVAPNTVDDAAHQMFSPNALHRRIAIDFLETRNNLDSVAPLIQALRFLPDRQQLNDALIKITGFDGARTWHDWMLWQEDHPEIKPDKNFYALKAVGEDHLKGPDGKSLARMPGHIAYWFAWQNFRPKGLLAKP